MTDALFWLFADWGWLLFQGVISLIAGIICLAIVAGATTLGQSANDTFVNVQEKVWGS